MSEDAKSELTVVTKAKDLCAYIVTITQKSPKQFRFTFVTRLQNFALDVIEKLIVYVSELVVKEKCIFIVIAAIAVVLFYS